MKGPGMSAHHASDSADAALVWFRRSVKDATGSLPTAEEEKYFADGHEVIRSSEAGGFTWRLEKRG